jgi:hypothetical protein
VTDDEKIKLARQISEQIMMEMMLEAVRAQNHTQAARCKSAALGIRSGRCDNFATVRVALAVIERIAS